MKCNESKFIKNAKSDILPKVQENFENGILMKSATV